MIHFSTSRGPWGLAALLVLGSPAARATAGGAALSVAPNPVLPRTCVEVLTTTERLVFPRRLKLGPDLVEHAFADEASARTLRALSTIFTALTPERMALLNHVLRGVPSPSWQILVPHELNPYFRAHPELVDQSVVDNYTILFQEFLESGLPAYELGLLATLLRGQPREHLLDEVDQRDLVRDESIMAARLRTAIARPRYREIIVDLLKDSSVHAEFQRSFATALSSEELLGFERLLPNIAKQVKRADVFELKMIREIFQALVIRVGHFAEDHDTFDHGFTAFTLKREGFLILTRHYLSRLRRPYATGSLVDLIDYLYFGTPLPAEIDAIYNAVVDGAKRLVLPMKTAYATRPVARAAIHLTPTKFELREIDFDAPKSTPRAPRARGAGGGVAAATLAEDVSSAALSGPALTPFTSFSETPANEPPRASVTYHFRYLRTPGSAELRVRIGPEALEFFNLHARAQRRFLNALHMGGTTEQSGIKELKVFSRRHAGSVYELKAPGSFRGLMLWVDETWQLISIVHKDDLDRAARHLEAL